MLAYAEKKAPFVGPFFVCAECFLSGECVPSPLVVPCMRRRRREKSCPLYAEKAHSFVFCMRISFPKRRMCPFSASCPLYAELVSLLRLGKEIRIQGTTSGAFFFSASCYPMRLRDTKGAYCCYPKRRRREKPRAVCAEGKQAAHRKRDPHTRTN